MRETLALAALAVGLLSAAPALACSPVITPDPEAGEPPLTEQELLRQSQARWRAEADTVFIAQLREGRMVEGSQIEFTLVPVATIHDGALPDAMLLYRWTPGNTCNPYTLNLTDLVVVFADVDQFGWGVVGLTVPDRLQDPPANFRQTVRDIQRGTIRGPALPE